MVGRGRPKPRLRVAYDPQDLRTIRVYDEHYAFIAEVAAEGFGHAGQAVSSRDVGEAIAEQRRYHANRRDVAQNAHHEWMSPAEVVGAEQSKAKPARPAADLKLVEVETPLDGNTAAELAAEAEQGEPAAKLSITEMLADVEPLAEKEPQLSPLALLDRLYGDDDPLDGEASEEDDHLRKAVGL